MNNTNDNFNEIIVKKRVLVVLLIYGVIVASVAMFFSLLIHYDLVLFMASFVFCVFSCVMFFVARKKYSPWLSLIELLMINFIYGPILFISTGGIYGASILWFTAGIIMIFTFKDHYELVVLSLVSAFLYFYFISYVSKHEYVITHVNSKAELFIEFVICIIAAAILILAITSNQYALFDKEKRETEEKRKIIQNASKAKARFLSNISNEIRVPMNSIIGMTEIVMKEDLDKITKEEVRTIRNSSYTLLSIIDDVLLYSRLDSGRFKMVTMEYNFAETLRQTMEVISAEFNNKDINFDVNLDKNIPSLLYGDEVYVKQVFQSLLLLSVENTSNGRIIFKVSCEKTDKADEILIRTRIADTGRGLSKLDVQYLFGTYNVYDSRQSSNLKGIGLKYSICKELLKLMHGDITVESIEGIGMSTEFTFRSKVADAEPVFTIENDEEISILVYAKDDFTQQFWIDTLSDFKVRIKFCYNSLHLDKILFEKYYQYIFLPCEIFEQSISTISKYNCKDHTYYIGDYNNTLEDFDGCRMIRRPVSCLNLVEVLNQQWKEETYFRKQNRRDFYASKAKILVVDDNAVNLKLIANLFQKYKIDIFLATSGEECMKKVSENKYDIVFLDHMLPDMNGMNLMESIRSLKDDYYRKLPIVMITPSIDISARDEYILAGFNDYIVKPVRAIDIEKCILDLLPSECIEEYTPVDEKTTNSNNRPGNVKIAAGLDTAKGLLNIGFNQEAYDAILNTYYTECKKNLDLLPELRDSEDLSLFTTYVHGMKSSSASIGAMEVSELFKQLEFAGKDQNRDFIIKNYEPYTDKLREMLEIVKEYLTTNNAFVDAEKENSLEGMELVELDPALLDELKICMDKMNLKRCDEIIASISEENFGSSINEEIHKLKKAYEGFDFHNAKIALTNIMNEFTK